MQSRMSLKKLKKEINQKINLTRNSNKQIYQNHPIILKNQKMKKIMKKLSLKKIMKKKIKMKRKQLKIQYKKKMTL